MWKRDHWDQETKKEFIDYHDTNRVPESEELEFPAIAVVHFEKIRRDNSVHVIIIHGERELHAGDHVKSN